MTRTALDSIRYVTVISLAVALILIAVLMGIFGVFLQGAQWLLTIGIILAVVGVILYLVTYVGGRRSGPPV